MKVTLIQSEENLGFGRANNLAFDRIRSDYVLILNPDTIVKPSAIDNLVHAMESDGRVGLAGPRLLNADGTLQPSVWPHPPTLATVLLEGLKLYKFLPRRIRASWLLSRHWSHDTRSEVPALSGAVMFARRQMIDKVGGFANEIHMYGEDAEWCVRIRQSGWKLLFEPSAEIIHLGGQSAIQRWGESERHVVEEKAWTEFQARYQTPARAASTLGARAFLLILYFLKQTVQRNDTTLLRKLIQIQFKGLKSIFTSPDQPSARS